MLRGGEGGEDGLLLYQLVTQRKDLLRSVVLLDIGTSRGFSAIAMTRALIDAGMNGHVWTVDVVAHN